MILLKYVYIVQHMKYSLEQKQCEDNATMMKKNHRDATTFNC